MDQVVLDVDDIVPSSASAPSGTANVEQVFTKFVSQPGIMRTENLQQALLDVGIDEAQSINAAHFGDLVTFEQFEQLVSRFTLQEHAFPVDKLEAMLLTMSSSEGVIEMDKMNLRDKQRLRQFLRSHGVALEDLQVQDRFSLASIQRRIAQELDDKRKAEWLQETGVLKAIASHLPYSVSQAAKGRTWGGRHGEIAKDVLSRLHTIGGLIESKAREKLCVEEPRVWKSFNGWSSPVAYDRPVPLRQRSPTPGHRHRSLGSLGALRPADAPGNVPPSEPHNSDLVPPGSQRQLHPASSFSDRRRGNSSPLAEGLKALRRRSIAAFADFADLPPTLPKLPSASRRTTSEKDGGLRTSVEDSWTPASSSGHLPRLRGSQGRDLGRWLPVSADSAPTLQSLVSPGSSPDPVGEGAEEARWWQPYANFRSEDVQWEDDERASESVLARCGLRLSWLRYEVRGLARAVSWRLLLLALLAALLTLLAGGAALLLWARRSGALRRAAAASHGRALGAFAAGELREAACALSFLAALSSRSPQLLALASAAPQLPPLPGAHGEERVLLDPAPSPSAVRVWAEAVAAVRDNVHGAVARSWKGVTLAPGGVVMLQWGTPGGEAGLRVKRAAWVEEATAGGEMAMLAPRLGEGSRRGTGGIVVSEAVMEMVAPLQRPPGANASEVWGLLVLEVEVGELLGDRLLEPLAQSGAGGEGGGAREVEEVVFELTSHRSERRPGQEGEGDAGEVLAATGKLSGEHVTVRVPLEEEGRRIWEWEFKVAFSGGFAPGWLAPAWAVVAVASAVIGAGTLLLLLWRRQHQELLYRIMPRRVVARLEQGRQVAEIFDHATVFFSDLVGFTDMSTRTSPLEVVMLLNDLYTELDKIAARHTVFKVDTIGDAYMVIGGAPDRCSGEEAAARVARFALEALEAVEANGSGMQMRCGMASGSVVGAVLGTAVPKYSFFGDTVNTASRMESTGKPSRLQVSQATMELLAATSAEFRVQERSSRMPVYVKGLGRRTTYWVTRSTAAGGSFAPLGSFPTSPVSGLLPERRGRQGRGSAKSEGRAASASDRASDSRARPVHRDSALSVTVTAVTEAGVDVDAHVIANVELRASEELVETPERADALGGDGVESGSNREAPSPPPLRAFASERGGERG